MDNWILILLLVFTFTAGYFAVRNLGRFPENDLRRPEDEIRRNVRKLHIAAEVPAMLDAVSPALSVYSDTDPFVEFFLGQASGQTLLQRLSQGTLDIVLLAENQTSDLPAGCTSVRIPRALPSGRRTAAGLSVERLEENTPICAVWSREVPNKDRDRVLFLMENME